MLIKIIESVIVVIGLTTYMIPMDSGPINVMNQNLSWPDKKEAYTQILDKMLEIRHNLSCMIDMELNNVMLDYMPDNIPEEERPYFLIMNPLCRTSSSSSSSSRGRRSIDSNNNIKSNETVTIPTCEKFHDVCMHQHYHDYRKIMDRRTTNLEWYTLY
ncbi:uncharacterized protein LOC143219637 [Lasioglossum baleicum]|uniref:uncharacterized protein LOC143219637 n=1 Tax=Lasioglossum baleicum TaxID=434251 RepID=UPI003FCE495D